jgi:hypothetical protein
MPLIIKVGVSRKVSQDYQSQGFNLDIQSELDPRVLDDTNQLADATSHLFELANDLLDQQVEQAKGRTPIPDNSQQKPSYNGTNPQNGGQLFNRNNSSNIRQSNNGTYSRPSNGNGQQSNGHRNGGAPKGTNGRTERPATSAQINAIRKMAEKFDTNGDSVAQEDFNCNLAELTIRQASELIDRMKKSLEAQEGQGAGR